MVMITCCSFCGLCQIFNSKFLLVDMQCFSHNKYHIAQNFEGVDLADSPTTAKILLSKISPLNNNANSVTTRMPKYHHPNVFSSFIYPPKLAPPKFCAIGYNTKQQHPGCKKARPNRKHHLASYIMHSTKKCDIWWRPRSKPPFWKAKLGRGEVAK